MEKQDFERYNQGFGKFGPMEQCDDGEWTRFQHAAAVLKEERRHNEQRLAEADQTIQRMGSDLEAAAAKIRELDALLKGANAANNYLRAEVKSQDDELAEAYRVIDNLMPEIALLKEQKARAFKVVKNKSTTIRWMGVISALSFLGIATTLFGS